MVISTNPRPTLYRNLYENTELDNSADVPSRCVSRMVSRMTLCWVHVGPATKTMGQYEANTGQSQVLGLPGNNNHTNGRLDDPYIDQTCS